MGTPKPKSRRSDADHAGHRARAAARRSGRVPRECLTDGSPLLLGLGGMPVITLGRPVVEGEAAPPRVCGPSRAPAPPKRAPRGITPPGTRPWYSWGNKAFKGGGGGSLQPPLPRAPPLFPCT
jgi:hypothetical protein